MSLDTLEQQLSNLSEVESSDSLDFDALLAEIIGRVSTVREEEIALITESRQVSENVTSYLATNLNLLSDYLERAKTNQRLVPILYAMAVEMGRYLDYVYGELRNIHLTEDGEVYLEEPYADAVGIYNVVHEVKNRLASIVMLLEPMTDAAEKYVNPTEEKKAENLKEAKEVCDALYESVKEQSINRLVRIDITYPVELRRAVNRDYDFEGARIVFELESEWSVGALKIPERLLHHTFYNLLSNAKKYTVARREGDPLAALEELKIKLFLEVSARGIEIQVWDTGIGIPKAEEDKIFAPGKRASNAADLTDGNGSGLSTLKDWLEEQGGRIEYQNRLDVDTQRGSIFTAFIPTISDQEG